jgi:hypothetical protein
MRSYSAPTKVQGPSFIYLNIDLFDRMGAQTQQSNSKRLQDRLWKLKMLVPLLTFSSVLLFSLLVAYSSPEEQYWSYYAYIPPSLANLSKPVYSWGAIVKTIKNYTTVPSNLDVIGIEDGTIYEVYDLSTNKLLSSGSLDKYQQIRVSFGSKQTSIEPFDVEDYYIKLVVSKPVSALLTGGVFIEEAVTQTVPVNRTLNTPATFVPSVDGGVIGKEFIFLAFPTYYQPKLTTDELNVWNIFATQDSSIKVYSADGKILQELSVGAFSMIRTQPMPPWNVYRVTSTGNIMVYLAGLNSMVFVPPVTGGYVGRSFMATRPGNIWLGDKQSFIVVALEDAKIEFYDMRKPADSSADRTIEVKRNEMAFDTYFGANVPIRVKSTGNITLLVGGNVQGWGSAWTTQAMAPQNIASDITFLGARAGQEVGFYAPYQAVIFATGDTDVEVNDIPRSMKADEFITLPSGMYVVKPSSAPVIIEVLANTNVIAYTGTGEQARPQKGFDNWGAYLIAPQVLYKSYQVAEEGGGLGLFLYIGIAVAALVIVVFMLLVLRKRR